MKIRQGFVSNSSSSSFVIMGFSPEYFNEFDQMFRDEVWESFLKNETFKEAMRRRAECQECGFVSNSSSSSFVLVFPLKLLGMYAVEHPVEFKVVNSVMKTNDDKDSDDMQIGVIHEFMSSGGYGTYDNFDGVSGLTDEESEIFNDRYDGYPGEVTWHFKDWLVENYPDKIITSDHDW